eukprot:Blabericola_migrator_1__695@NODE_1172_length_5219_cov_9_845885_g796_i0_p1_GENE_NODE_1172_length_5219_cov_9_845885_g796_i0NODE_1172_length_5219_cov_9_845885_g796_i0_p1_ORF_typecomplete_len1077_score193_07HipN/PF18253_1/0_61HipN/PF18253_1/4_7e03_NODE_1172_length_5219_cov_9_845885_g796_i014324662
MQRSGRSVLQIRHKCQTTSAARTLSLGICCVLGVYEGGYLASNRTYCSPLPAVQQYSQIPTNAPSCGNNKDWHKLAQFLLTQAVDAQVQVRPEFWNLVAEVLGRAEKVSPLSLSNDEINTINQLTKLALKFAPLYPCVSQCAKLCYEIMASVERGQESSQNAGTTKQQLPVAVETNTETPMHRHHPPVEGWMHSTPPPPPSKQWAGADSEKDLKGGNAATQMNWTFIENNVAQLIADLDRGHQDVGGYNKAARPTVIKEPLKRLHSFLSQCKGDPSTLDPQVLKKLNKMRSSLINAKAKLNLSPRLYVSKRYMISLNNVILKISHLWHQAHLANKKIDKALQPQDFKSLEGVADFPKELSPSRCAAFTTYSALVTTDDDKEVKVVLDDFLIFSDLATRPIDLTTAKLYLLILLYLKHGNLNLIKVGVQDHLDRLISKLRDDIFESRRKEISLHHTPEFKDFCLAYFEANPCQKVNWRDSLRANKLLVQDGQRPIITKLLQHGRSFRRRLSKLKKLAKSASEAEIHAATLDSLQAFHHHLLNIDPAINVLTDDETLAYFKQFAAFGGGCIDECAVQGHAASRKQVKQLKTTLECLQWCRLLSSYLEVTSPSLLEETYATIANALILKSLWSHETTTLLSDSERAFISQGILSALRSNKLDDELLACTKMSLDQSVPPEFLKPIYDELLLTRAQRTISDHDKMVTLLASECRMNLFRDEIASNSSRTRIPFSIENDFREALVDAQMIAKGVHILPAPDVSLSARLQQRFVDSPAHEAARKLSVDVILEEALGERTSDDLTVSEVARHVATYLLGDPVDEQWLDFLTCQVQWCGFTAGQLAEGRGELTSLIQSLSNFLQIFWYKERWANPLDSRAEATPGLIRHFVNTATLKWLCGKLMEDGTCPDEYWQSLHRLAGDHAFAWLAKWMILMHGSQALFPPGVAVDNASFRSLCIDVFRHMHLRTTPTEWLEAPLDNFALSIQLRHLIKGISLGMVTEQDVQILLLPHASPVVLRWNRNLFLTFLLYVWHNVSLPADKTVITECIKNVLHEKGIRVARNKSGERMYVSTLQTCIRKVLAI